LKNGSSLVRAIDNLIGRLKSEGLKILLKTTNKARAHCPATSSKG
jgi:hypothetical protein